MMLDTLPEERFDRITRLAARIFDVPMALVSLVDADRQWFKSRHGLDATETPREISFCGHAILQEDTFVVCDALKDQRFADNPLVVGDPSIRFYAGQPLHGVAGTKVGTLCLIDDKPRDFSEAEQALLAELAAMVDHELSMLAQSTTDELTHISNRRGFNQIAKYMLAFCHRNAKPAAVIAIDLDGFKQINDEFGHAAGDRVLQQFAGVLVKNFRDSDVVARLGGDEFCVLISDASLQQGVSALERLGREFSDSVIAKEFPGLSWSAGLAEFDPREAPNLDQLLRDADAQMYNSKQDSKRRAQAR
jgi:diguanylate cyclase (GGDEF)-like protein